MTSSFTSIDREFEGAEFGDLRLGKRLCLIASALVKAPERSFPRGAPNAAALRATYRFVNNETVTPESILAPHRRQTVARVREVGCAVVIHDTTQLEFPGEADREGLGFIRSIDDQGFSLHCALAVAGDGSGRPLGMIAHRTWVRTERKPKRRRGGETFKDARRESTRWGEQVFEVEAMLEPSPVIHVMDREGDSFALIQDLVAHSHRFVIRMRQDRVVLDENDDRDGYASEAISAAAYQFSLAVPLSRRVARTMPAAKHKARYERPATLSVSATSIRLKPPPYMPLERRDSVAVNIVHVIEVAPPEGQDAVSWVLMTTEPIDDGAALLRILDAYRTRWLIEEYFKALKTGCAIERRQLESYDSLANALAIFMPIAWQLLLLRNLHRSQPDAPAEHVLTPTQIDILRARLPKLMTGAATVEQALRAVAYLGGHFIKKPPGWQVLGRGLEDLLMLEEGWRLATQSKTNCV